ncbi:ABC-three component system protein [Prosthecobacter debontii]|nr:ABC-three component system protein [Prosthecobacter debontii]
MTELLARAGPGDLVSLEVLDDIAVQKVGGEVSLVQSKSALTSNPVADRALPLWKTFSNWATELAEMRDFTKLSLVIAVSNPRSGDFATLFHNASTLDEAKSALLLTKNAFKDELSSATSDKKDLTFHLKRFFQSELNISCEIIRCFRLETNIVSPQEDLPNCFPFIPESHLEDIVVHALGWVKRQAEILIEKRLPAILSRDDFHKEMVTFIRKHRERAILRSFAPAKIPDDKKAELMPRMFVRQLETVGADFLDRVQAVSDYFRTAYDKTRWGALGEIHPTSFDEFNDDLHRAWQNVRRQVEVQHSSLNDAGRGLLVYSECCRHSADLEGQKVPNHFVPGSFHHLSDEQLVGWHPRFAEILATKGATIV